MTEAQLRVLVTVADVGGFSLAARRLAMSQSGVSRAVAHLEDELGAELFRRLHGTVALTPAGLRVADHAREVLARIDAMRREAGAGNGDHGGQLRIGSLPSLTARLLSPLLSAFRARYPSVQVVLQEDVDDVVLERVRDGSVDVGVVVRPVDDLEVRPLARVSLVAVLPADDPVAAQAKVALADLESAPLLAPRTGFERLVADAFAAEGRTPRLAFETGEAATALTLVGEGLGVAVVPELLADGLPRGAVMRPLDPPITLDVGLAARARDTPAAAAFLDLA